MTYMANESSDTKRRKTGEDMATKRLHVHATQADINRFTDAWVAAAQHEPAGSYLSFSSWVRRALHRQADADLSSQPSLPGTG
jgi:hypothetical protein